MITTLLLLLTLFPQSMTKEQKRAAKEEEKKPAQIVIAAPIQRVKDALVAEYAEKGYDVFGTSEYTIEFSHDLGAGFFSSLLNPSASNTTKFLFSFALVPTTDGTLVKSAMFIVHPRVFGRDDRQQLKPRKESKVFILEALERVKKKCESKPKQPSSS